MILWHWFFSYFHLTLRRGSSPAWQRKRNQDAFLLTWFMFVFLQRMSFVICHLKNAGQFEKQSRSHFLIALINPACSEGERTEETARFAFLLPDSRSFCKIRIPFARLAFLLLTVEALPFALVVLTLKPKVFWCETCLLCVDVCFV